MERPVVFVSYSHDSETHSETVLGLAERLRRDGIDARIDQYEPGTPEQGWPRWMLDSLDAADFVLVVCTATYYRRFRGHEDPDRGKGVDWEGAIITQEIYDSRSRTAKFVPILLEGAEETHIPEPLRSRTHYRLTSEQRYAELKTHLLGAAGVEPSPLGELPGIERRRGVPLTFGAEADRQRVAVSRLQHATARLVGRDDELARLDAAWTNPEVRVVTMVAWGGVGKTSLVASWAADLAKLDYDGADFFDWSFYSQGVREHGGASADAFVDKALRFFGDAETASSPLSPWDKGERLAELVAARRTLLILDGLEPLQHSPQAIRGRLKDPAIAALLRGLAARNPGLCVVTTRERVEDLEAARGAGTAPEWKLERLSTAAGVALLEELGVEGPRTELEELVEEVHGHALTLNLLGRFLRDAHGGDVRRRDVVDFAEVNETVQGGHAFRVMEAYERWLEAEGETGARQLAVLRLLGLFDRPASAACLAALRRAPAIPGLTDAIVPLRDTQWNLTVSSLEKAALLLRDGDDLDAHPLVREHFARRLQDDQADAWKEAHGRLFDHLKDSTEHRPDGLEGLQPLYQAVAHGCRAGRYQEACFEVYRDRISRGSEAYVVRQLGAFGADLGAVACFFDEPWSRVSPSLTEADQAWLLNQAAFRLRALGRLKEAIQPMRADLDMITVQENWSEASKSAGNLSQLELTLGDVDDAVRDAKQAMDFANRSGDAFLRMAFRTALADALHQAGLRKEALTRFREAEEIQTERQPEYPRLTSLQGFLYCDLLLADAERAAGAHGSRDDSTLRESLAEAEHRAEGAQHAWQKIFSKNQSTLTIALDHLTLGRARLYRAILDEEAFDNTEPEIEKAVGGLRRAGTAHHIPRGLLTRAWLRFVQGRPDAARADLDEAEEIARRGPMPLFLADVALYRARFFHDRDALAEARRLIDAHGYGRRREELEALEATAPPPEP